MATNEKTSAKSEQGYKDRPLQKICSECIHFEFDMLLPNWMALCSVETEKVGKPLYGEKHKQEKNLRCGIGGFVVKKQGSCSKWAPRGHTTE